MVIMCFLEVRFGQILILHVSLVLLLLVGKSKSCDPKLAFNSRLSAK